MTAALDKDLVGLAPLSAEQIRLILDTAEPFKEVSERPIKKVPALRGKTIVNLFFEASTRTRISFEFAEKRLSADTVNVAASGSAVQKGETLVDTARGDLVREDPLARALEEGHVGAAGLDVYFEEPKIHPRLLAAPRTVLLPHLGSATPQVRRAMAAAALANVRAVLAGQAPLTPVFR